MGIDFAHSIFRNYNPAILSFGEAMQGGLIRYVLSMKNDRLDQLWSCLSGVMTSHIMPVHPALNGGKAECQVTHVRPQSSITSSGALCLQCFVVVFVRLFICFCQCYLLLLLLTNLLVHAFKFVVVVVVIVLLSFGLFVCLLS